MPLPIISKIESKKGNVPIKSLVTNIQFLRNLRSLNLLNDAIRRGIISIHFLDYETIYNTYMKARQKYAKMESYKIASVLCDVSETTVRIAVKKMKSFD
jgi:hypothetical protein